MFLKLEGVNDGSATDAVVGENTITGTVSGVTNLVAVFELSGMSAGTIVDFVSCEFKAKDEEDTTSPSEEDTTSPTEEDTTAPSTGGDYDNLEWTRVGTSDYYVASANNDFPFQLVEEHAEDMLIIPQVAAGSKPIWPDFTNATLNGNEFSQVPGAGIYIKYADLVNNAYNVYQATSAVDGHVFQIIIKAGNPSGGEEETTPSEEDTTPSEEDTTAPEVTKPEMVGNPLVELNDFGNGQVVFVAGLDVIKNATLYNLYVDGTLWGAVTNGQNIPVSEFEAGTHLFQVTGVNDAGESELSPGHTFVIPSGVEVTTYTVTIDGNKVAEVEEGSTYTLGDAKYGYYADGQMYKAGTVLTVTSDVALTSVNELSVTMAGGAAIKTSTPAGLKFQATVNSNNAEAVKSEAIKEGMLITANDIFENNNSVLDLTSAYTKLDIVNAGWANADTMTYCGAVANIVEQNYVRNFVARAYVTVTYTDGTSTTVYSDMGSVRSVSQVAAAVQNAGYPNLSEVQRLVIDSFIK